MTAAANLEIAVLSVSNDGATIGLDDETRLIGWPDLYAAAGVDRHYPHVAPPPADDTEKLYRRLLDEARQAAADAKIAYYEPAARDESHARWIARFADAAGGKVPRERWMGGTCDTRSEAEFEQAERIRLLERYGWTVKQVSRLGFRG